MYRFSKFKEFEGRGGPVIENKAEKVTQTREGRYVVGTIAKHKSASRWAWSTIVWGTPLRAEGNVLQIQVNGAWVKLSANSGFKSERAAFKKAEEFEQSLYDRVKDEFTSYKKELRSVLTSKEFSESIPASWIFNDFGHLSIKYFKDLNNNHKLDKKESYMTDFIHTTPFDEYVYGYRKQAPLEDSHGCIHVHPRDIDQIIQYIKIGSVIQVHSYTEKMIPVTFDSAMGWPMYELHFFPYLNAAAGKETGSVVIYEVTKI